MSEPIRAVRGMNDILADQTPRWRRVEETFRSLSALYGFEEVRTPIVESTALFVRSIGEETDIVEKEMYTFTDKGEHSLTLRPEGTASAVRAYLEHHVYARQPVTKWIYLGPMFRRERPAKGRYRQFYQAGAEVYGDAGPWVDAELIALATNFLRALGVEELEVVVNTLGGPDVRRPYSEALVRYLEEHRDALCPDCQRRMRRAPFRVLDCKVEADQKVAENAPPVVDYLGEDDRDHFQGLLDALRVLDVAHRVDARLVRGLDYYTRTLFEIRGKNGSLGAQNALVGGGRYDPLIASLGGPPTPAIGFAVGLDRLLLSLPEKEVLPRVTLFVVPAHPSLRAQALELASLLRREGWSVDADLRGQSLKSQLRRADKSGAEFALILGEEELKKESVLLRYLREQRQELVLQREIVNYLQSLLAR